MKIDLRQPTGIAPRIDPTQLRDNAAQEARNVRFDAGNCRPLRGLAMLRENWGAGINSIYRFGQDVSDPTLYWFRSANDVDYLKAPFFGDTRELTFLTEGGKLKYTTNTAALAGEPFPTVTYEIPGPPTGVMTASVTGTGTGLDQTLVYVMTVATAEGFQTRPGAALTVIAKDGQTVALAQQALPSGPYNFGTGSVRRLYRSTNAGTLELRAEKTGADSTDWVDAVSNSSMGTALEAPYNLEPPSTGVHSLVGAPGFFIAVAAGRDIYPSKSAPNVHGFPEAYRITVEHPVVGMCAIDDGIVVGTTGYPVVLAGTDPSSLQPIYRREFPQACVSKRSMVAMPGGAVYATPDGLAIVSSGGARMLTEALFNREQWQAYNPASIHAYAWEGKYVGFYDAGGGNRGGFIFDPSDERAPFSTFDTYAAAGFYEPMFDRLYLQVDNDLVAFDAGSFLSGAYRSKEFVLPHGITFNCARVKANDYASLTLQVYGDGALVATRTITDNKAFRLPRVSRYSRVSIRLTGTSVWYEASIATSMTEIGR